MQPKLYRFKVYLHHATTPQIKGTADLRGGWGHAHIATDWHYSFRFPSLGNSGAQSLNFGSESRQKLGGGFRHSNLLGAHMNTPIGDKLFQDIPRRVATFRENRPRDVEKSVDEEKLKN